MATIEWSGVSGDWTTGADWTGGVVPGAADDADISAAGAYTLTITSAVAANSATVNDSSAVVAVNSGGVLNLGSTLTVDAGIFRLIFGGTVRGGTLSANGGAFQWFGGTLDGVTYDGTLDLSGTQESLLVSSNGLIANGAGGVGPGLINDTGYAAALYFENTQTFDNATINAGSAGGSGWSSSTPPAPARPSPWART